MIDFREPPEVGPIWDIERLVSEIDGLNRIIERLSKENEELKKALETCESIERR